MAAPSAPVVTPTPITTQRIHSKCLELSSDLPLKYNDKVFSESFYDEIVERLHNGGENTDDTPSHPEASIAPYQYSQFAGQIKNLQTDALKIFVVQVKLLKMGRLVHVQITTKENITANHDAHAVLTFSGLNDVYKDNNVEGGNATKFIRENFFPVGERWQSTVIVANAGKQNVGEIDYTTGTSDFRIYAAVNGDADAQDTTNTFDNGDKISVMYPNRPLQFWYFTPE